MHIRQQIREAVKTKLAAVAIDGVALTPYTNRVQDLREDELPIAVILTEDENSQTASKDDDLDRTIDVTVVLVVDGESDTIDDDLDAWAEAVEAVMKSVPPARKMQLASTSLDLRADDEGTHWFGYLVLEYQAKVFTD